MEMSPETVAGIVGGLLSILTCVGLGTKWFLEWYSGYKERSNDKYHKQALEREDAEHKRGTERSNEFRAIESSLVLQWKALVTRLEKQVQQHQVDGEKKQGLIDLLATEHRHCRETLVGIVQWAKYANSRMKSLDPNWDMDPPHVEDEGTDFEFHARSSAQDTAVLKAMTQEPQPDIRNPDKGKPSK